MNDQRRKKYVKRIKKAYGSELPDCPNQEVSRLLSRSLGIGSPSIHATLCLYEYNLTTTFPSSCLYTYNLA